SQGEPPTHSRPGHSRRSLRYASSRRYSELASPGMGILEGKKIVITGVLTDASIAYSVARIAIEEGADIVLTGAGRALSLTQRTARKLPGGADIPVYELDVTVPDHLAAVREELAERWGRVDGVLHLIGF